MEDLEKELRTLKSLKILKDSDGGKIIIERNKSDIDSLVRNISKNYKTLSHIELIALIADLNSKMSLLEPLNSVEDKIEIIKEELKYAKE